MAGNVQLQATHGLLNPSGGQPVSATYYAVGGTLQTIDVILAAGTNQPVAASWLAPGTSSGDLQLIYIYSNMSFTLYTNNPSGSSPTNTISVTGGIPIPWDIQQVLACPFTGNVTSWYVTNANAMRLQARILTL
jgi:hypothetical protein